MSGGQIFAVVWGVGALGLGFVFARYPGIVVDLYVKQMGVTRLTKRLQERRAPRAAVRVWYRIMGVVFMVLGPFIAILAIVGVFH